MFASELPDLLSTLADDEPNPWMVDKDYWLTRVLRRVASALKGAFLFKGGTSLSMGHGLIDRFSEDMDLLITSDSPDETIQDMVDLASEELGSEGEETINSTAIALQMGQRDNLTSRDGKHPYDVYCILDHPASLKLLSDSDEKSRMLESIAESSGRWFGVPFTRPDGGYADSAAFSTEEQGEEFQRVYERALKSFLWHGAARPEWHEVVERITSFRSLL